VFEAVVIHHGPSVGFDSFVFRRRWCGDGGKKRAEEGKKVGGKGKG
jgi:hypothetical protein